MRMRLLIGFIGCLALAGCVSTVKPALSPDLRPLARKLAADFNPAIITARVVMSVGQGGNSREFKSESNATVLQPDGLAIISLSAVDPVSMFRRMSDSEDTNFESRVKDLKYILPDRRELPATIVLRDADLNIAFLRPLQKTAQPMTAIDLKNAAEAQLLDPFVILARMGSVADRQISVQAGVIESIVNKPRKFYVPGGIGLNGLAVPAFTEAGKVLGIVVLRTQIGGDDDIGMMGQGNQRVVPIILPAADIAEVAAQAPAKGEKLDAATPGSKRSKTGEAEPKDGGEKAMKSESESEKE